VEEALMDLVMAPLEWGTPDEDQPGIFQGRIPGTNLGILYVPNEANRRIYVAAISEA
jgi:hypothetical protein